MNIAFSAILALVLLIPGLLFARVRRNSGEFAESVSPPAEPFSVEIATAIIAASILHTIMTSAVWLLSLTEKTPQVNLAAVLMLFLGKFGDKDARFDEAIGSITNYPLCIVTYFALACGLAVVSARIFAARLDVLAAKAKLNDSRDACISEWREFFKLEPNTEAALVTAVVDMGGGAYLFIGKLVRLHFDRSTGNLDRIQLEGVMKRKLDKDRAEGCAQATEPPQEPSPEDGFEDVFGHKFILRLDEIKTLNVVYIFRQNDPATKSLD